MSGLYEILDSNDIVEKAISEQYAHPPSMHSFKLFQFEDIGDFPFIQVVAETANVTKLDIVSRFHFRENENNENEGQ